MTEEIFNAQNIDKRFGGIQALDGVSIQVKKKSILGLIGPNGSGKTTFFNVTTGWLPNESEDGSITFNSERIDGLMPHKITLRGLSRTFQKTRIFAVMTVLDNMLLAAPRQGGEKFFSVFFRRKEWKKQESEIRNRAFEILKFLEIDHLVDQPAKNLSGGQQKLLALGRVLMASDKLILLDEPVAGVNPVLAKKIFNQITKMREEEEITFFVIEHNMDVIMSFCDEILVMHRGDVLTGGTPDEIKANKDVVEAYLGG
ncbi:MAG: ABC transporter ATP-binding protein [Candidatus Hodarchaeota archaeon]